MSRLTKEKEAIQDNQTQKSNPLGFSYYTVESIQYGFKKDSTFPNCK